MNSRLTVVAMTFAAMLLAVVAGCETAPPTQAKRAMLVEEAQTTVARFKDADPSLIERFDNAFGYAVFPTVGKGGAGIGGAYGRGVVYSEGEMIGYADLSQGTVGLQLGGQAYSEVIFFEDARAVRDFTSGEFALAAQVSAVAATAGAAETADYDNGVMVFTMAKGGLMYEASVGGQKFNFVPASGPEMPE